MIAIAFGFISALAWGVHDLLVRVVSQRASIYPTLLAALFFGWLLQLPTLAFAPAQPLAVWAWVVAGIAGVSFGIGMIALYHAFRIGPVALVSPIVGAYPILSVAWAVITGTQVSLIEWLAVFGVTIGIGIVASASDEQDRTGSRRVAILWSILSGLGFATYIASGQIVARMGGEIFLLAPTRLTAFLVVFITAWATGQIAWPRQRDIPVLMAIGGLDAFAASMVIYAGKFDHAELAAVVSATFGIITIILAALFLGERLKTRQWLAIMLVFGAIACLAL